MSQIYVYCRPVGVQYCSETPLTRDSRFHTSTPPGIEPGSLIMGSKQVDHWTSGTVCESSEIAGSRQYIYYQKREHLYKNCTVNFQ